MHWIGSPIALTSLQTLKGYSLFCTNGSIYSFMDIWSSAISSCNCVRTCILNLHVYQKSSVNFSLWDIQQYRKHYTLAVFLPTYGYDQDSIRLQWSLLLSDHIIILISSQCQPVFFNKSLSYDTLGQTLYDTYNSTLCVLNCYCLSLDSPPLL